MVFCPQTALFTSLCIGVKHCAIARALSVSNDAGLFGQDYTRHDGTSFPEPLAGGR